MNWLAASFALFLAAQPSAGFWIDTTERNRPAAESDKDEKACLKIGNAQSSSDVAEAINRENRCMTDRGWKVSECPVRYMLIRPDGRVNLEGSPLNRGQMRAEIKKMIRSPCPPFIHAKGMPWAAGPVLQEFRRAGYDTRKIAFY